MKKITAPIALLLVSFTIILISVYRSGFIVEGDVFWQTRAGIDWLSSFKIISVDTWSYQPKGLWIPNSWGWNLILATFYNISNSHGLFVLGSLLNAILLIIITLSARQLGSKWSHINLLLIISMIYTFPILSIRPHNISGLVSLVLVFYHKNIAHAIEKEPASIYFIYFILNLLMINIHLAWPAYFIASYTGLSHFLLRRNKKNLNQVMALGIFSFLGILFNPLGLKLFSHIIFTVNNSNRVIYEWGSALTDFFFIPPTLLIFYLFWKYRNATELVAWTTSAITFGSLGFYAIRFTPWSFLFALPCLSHWLSNIKFPEFWNRREFYYLSILSSTFIVFIINSLPQALKLHGTPESTSLIAQLPRQCHLFSSDILSAPIPLYRPDVKVFIDGRNDYWGPEHFTIASRLINHPSTIQLDQVKANCILINSKTALAQFLLSQPNWIRLSLENKSGKTLEVWGKKN